LIALTAGFSNAGHNSFITVPERVRKLNVDIISALAMQKFPNVGD
jgi:hypothetical protein